MSAIAGILWRDRRNAKSIEVEKMLSPMWRRGPHGQSVWFSKNIALGNSMLRSTPESLNEAQPFTKQNLTITADARIDNREELIKEFSGASNAITDSELITLGYEKWGEDCLQKLIGDFVFAIWDEKEKTLFCARDHFGIKPFHYFVSPQFFAFASDPRGLLAHPNIPKKINESRIADIYVSWLEGADKTSTFYLDIYRLPPARKIKVSTDSFSINTYWSLEPGKEIHFKSDEEYEEAFREIFTEAVSCRLRGTPSAASMLSGGIDSSAIVCVARDLMLKENNGEKLKVFSAVSLDENKCIERPYINAVLEAGGLEANLLRENELEQFTEDLTANIRDADDLFFYPDLPYIMYAFARKQGLHILFDGVDGDCVTSPNGSYFAEYTRGQWFELFKEARGHAGYFQSPFSEYLRVLWNHGAKTFAKRLIPKALLQNYRHRYSQKIGSVQYLNESLIERNFAKRVGVEERIMSVTGDTDWETRTYRENDCQTLKQPFLTSALERYDRIAMMSSIEGRHPFFDKRLVEFCLRLPLKQKAGRGVPKMLIRRSLRNMPEKVRLRGFANVNLNVIFLPKMIAHQRKLIDEAFDNNLKEIDCYVNTKKLLSSYQSLTEIREKKDAQQMTDIWTTALLVLWLRRNL